MSTNITKTHLVLFSLPWAVSAVMHGPIAGVLPALYAESYALDLTVIGTVLLIARIFDAVTDPMIGFLSDRTVSRFGKRKPWIAAGAFLTVLAIWFLFRPGESVTMTHFLVLTLLLFLAWTIMEIPAVAWILEMSRDTRQRTRINASRSIATFLGAAVFYGLPAIVPDSDGSMNFRVLGFLAIIVAVAVPVTTFLMVRFVPNGDVFQSEAKPRISELWGSIKGNKPFLQFLSIYVFIGLASGIGGVLSFMYIDSYLKIGNRFSEVFLPMMIVGPLTIPFWTWALNKFGKYRLTATGFLIYAFIMPLLWFVEPGETAFVPALMYFMLLGAFTPLLMVSFPAILGDIIDHDELETGKNRAGQYSAFLTLLAKGTAAIGGPVAFIIVGLFGYQPGAETQDQAAIDGLRFTANLLPTIVVIPGILLLFRFPITDAKQLEMKAELEERARQLGEEFADPALTRT